MIAAHPGAGVDDCIIPVVGECDDSCLDDARGMSGDPAGHGRRAAPAPSPVVEGVVGAGTGMTCLGYKGGIGPRRGRARRIHRRRARDDQLRRRRGARRRRRSDRPTAPGRRRSFGRDAGRGQLHRVVATDAPLSHSPVRARSPAAPASAWPAPARPPTTAAARSSARSAPRTAGRGWPRRWWSRDEVAARPQRLVRGDGRSDGGGGVEQPLRRRHRGRRRRQLLARPPARPRAGAAPCPRPGALALAAVRNRPVEFAPAARELGRGAKDLGATGQVRQGSGEGALGRRSVGRVAHRRLGRGGGDDGPECRSRRHHRRSGRRPMPIRRVSRCASHAPRSRPNVPGAAGAVRARRRSVRSRRSRRRARSGSASSSTPAATPALPSLGTIVATEGGPGYATTSSRVGVPHPVPSAARSARLPARRQPRYRHVAADQLRAAASDSSATTSTASAVRRSSSARAPISTAPRSQPTTSRSCSTRSASTRSISTATPTARSSAQTFAVRHGDRLRTLVLDASYPVEGQDPWYRDRTAAIVDAVRLRVQTLARVRVARWRSDPTDPGRQRQAARAPVARARRTTATATACTMTVDPGDIGLVAGVGRVRQPGDLPRARRRDPRATSTRPIRSCAAACGSSRENEPRAAVAVPRQYSQGLYVAATATTTRNCGTSRPRSPIGRRSTPRRSRTCAPPTPTLLPVHDLRLDPLVLDRVPRVHRSGRRRRTACSRCRRPRDYPDVPTLRAVGRARLARRHRRARTSSRRASRTRRSSSITNGTHVMAVSDFGRCASNIAVRFVATKSAGDTRCASKYNEVPLLEAFPRTSPMPRPHRRARACNRRCSTGGSRPWRRTRSARCCRGGSPTTTATGVGFAADASRYTGERSREFKLQELRFVDDVAVSGTLNWDRTTGWIDATVTVAGPHGESGQLQLHWNDWEPTRQRRVQGQIGGRPVDLQLPQHREQRRSRWRDRRRSAFAVAVVGGAVRGRWGRHRRGPMTALPVHWDTCTWWVEDARCGRIAVAVDPVDASAGTIPIGFELYPRSRRPRRRRARSSRPRAAPASLHVEPSELPRSVPATA